MPSPENPPDLENVLGGQTSPYLRQHADNPVHWQVWNAETLRLAQRLDRPILLSVGYSACHWCHVMAHESFEDQDTADVMNALFINIKVDREERPDLDITYQNALALMGEQGGWPLTMFLTPQGEPFWGGTYFPPTPRWGRPAFTQALKAVAHTWARERDKIATNIAQLAQGLDQLRGQPGDEPFSLKDIAEAAIHALNYVDFVQGGTRGAPKFPQPTFFSLIWRARRAVPNQPMAKAVTVTLAAMAQGGIYDHLGGGFARYSTDEAWLVPHFEKMLYDNALLIELMADVWRETGDDLLRLRVEETIAWMDRDLSVTDAEGRRAYAAAFDADSEGIEGKFYVWDRSDVDALLGEDAALFRDAYDVSRIGNWEGSCILNRTDKPDLRDAETEARLARCRSLLLAERAKRIPPGRDDKVLCDWNAMTAHALVRAALVFNRLDWLDRAAGLMDFLQANLLIDGRWRHCWSRIDDDGQGTASQPAVLDDIAHLGRAALALHCATGESRWLDLALDCLDQADSHYRDRDGGGYFVSADDTADIIHRPKSALDNAVPSGNGVMADLIARTLLVTGDDSIRPRIDSLMTAFAGAPAGQHPHLTLLLMAQETNLNAETLVVVGATDPDHPLVRAAIDSAPERSVIQLAPAPETLPAGHPAQGKGLVAGKPTAYLCRQGTCSLPFTAPEALSETLLVL